MAFSSLRCKNRWNHDVFLSFRGPDTRNTFTGHLHHEMQSKGINVFIDNELQRGEVITSELLRVIEESRVSIVVLSEKYASSSFCLDELEKILKCGESKGQTVMPVFYHVDPTDVEEQRGTFGQEFAKLEAQLNEHFHYCRLFPSKAAIFLRNDDDLDEQRNNDEKFTENIMEKVQKWRLALTEIARLAGWHLKNVEITPPLSLSKMDHESNIIQDIVKNIWKKLDYTSLHVADHPVGLASRVECILEKLNMESQDVCMVGFHGMGGVGKTTTAAALYNTCANQFEFEGSCFLSKVGEESKKHGIVELQQTLLSKLLVDQGHILKASQEGMELIKRRLRNKKVLIVIDDVDHREQLQQLVGGLEWFGEGSIIIITTRNSHLLEQHGVTMMHEIKELEFDEALQLFSYYAFKEPQPDQAFMELSSLVIGYTSGLPLALIVLGSSLYKRSAPQWNDMLEKLKRVPNEIDEVLKVSYDSLDSEEKTIFLDIAFFFRKKRKDEVTKFLDECGFGANLGIQRLIQNSLVYVDSDGRLEMHDLLEAMGTKIAYEESSRLCIREREDILRLFVNDKRAYDVKILVLDLYREEEVSLNWLQNLSKLRVLVILNGCFTKIPKKLPNNIKWLEWRNNCLTSISFGSLPPNLTVHEMYCWNIKKFSTGMFKVQKFINLTRMSLIGSKYLREMVDFSSFPNIKVLDLIRCEKLKKIHKSVGNLKTLEELNLAGCCSLTSLPNLLDNQCLKSLRLTDCLELENLPNLPISIVVLRMDHSGIKEIPLFIGNLINLETIDASNCKSLICVSNSIYKFTNFSIDLHCCPRLTHLPEAESSLLSSNQTLSPFNSLDLSLNEFVSLPINTFKFIHIAYLSLNYCESLVEIPELPRSLKWLKARKCKSLVRFSQFQFRYPFEGDFINCQKLLGENEKRSWREMVEREEVHPPRSYSIIIPGNEIPEWFRYPFCCDANSHSFQLPSSLFNPHLISIAYSAIFQSPKSVESFDIKFSINEFGIHRSRVDHDIKSEHMWLGFHVLEFESDYFRKLSEAEEISCQFVCTIKEEVLKRVGVHFIYKN